MNSGHFSVPQLEQLQAREFIRVAGLAGTYQASQMKRGVSSKSSSEPYRQLEDVLGCKWSVSVLQAIYAGVTRPGALERHIAGISTKVLSERLRKLEDYRLIAKVSYDTSPPRTEYSLTGNGRKLVAIIGQIRALDADIHGEALPEGGQASQSRGGT